MHKLIPPWARYIATDHCGARWYFEQKPIPDDFHNEWICTTGKLDIDEASLQNMQPCYDWRTSCKKLPAP